jgi:hypothetical protein
MSTTLVYYITGARLLWNRSSPYCLHLHTALFHSEEDKVIVTKSEASSFTSPNQLFSMGLSIPLKTEVENMMLLSLPKRILPSCETMARHGCLTNVEVLEMQRTRLNWIFQHENTEK